MHLPYIILHLLFMKLKRFTVLTHKNEDSTQGCIQGWG